MNDLHPTPNAVAVRLEIEAGPDDAAPRFEVVSGRMTAALSELYEVRLIVQSNDASLHLGPLLRRRAVVEFDNEPYLKGLTGIVAKARALSTEPTGKSRYELVVVPAIWLLSKRRNHRIFRGTTVIDIAERLLDEHALGASSISPLLLQALAVRDYTVQYGETDLHLFQRLLADEGLAFYFDFALGGQLVVVEDTSKQSMHIDAPLPLKPASGLVTSTPYVESCEPSVETAFARAAVRDYDWQRPAYIIEGTQGPPAQLVGDSDLEHYEFEVGEVSSGDAAYRRAGQIEAANIHPTRRLSVRASVLVAPGTRIRIDGSPRPETEHELLVCSFSSWWSTDTDAGTTASVHDLACADARNTFRPQRLDKPRIAGVQTGLVVGADGKEIDVDEHGQVEVEFRWDRRDLHGIGASRRVRVSQGWAGVGYGLVALPRVNDEVVVAFLDGDPDQPLIVGRLHNPARPSPLDLPKDSTVTTWRSRSSPGGDGYNEILMDNLAGQERLEMHAQLDFTKVVERDAKEKVGRNLDLKVMGNTNSNITGTATHAAGVASSFNAPTFSVWAEELSLHGDNTGFTSGTRQDVIDSSFNVEAGSEYLTVKDVFQVNGPHFHVFASANIHLQANGASVEMDGGKIELKIGGSSILMEAGVITIISPLINLNP